MKVIDKPALKTNKKISPESLGRANLDTSDSSKIVCGDVIQVLSNFPAEEKFDVIIADPPYNIGKDFGNNFDNLKEDEYVKWSQRWLKLCFKLLAENGLIYVYGYPEILARVAVHYPINQQRWLVWHYTNKTTPGSKFWQRSYESILCLWSANGKRPELEIDQIREPYTETYLQNAAGKVRKGTMSRFGQGKKTVYQAHVAGALPRDVLKVSALAGGSGASERWFMCHDCQDQVFPPKQINNHRHHKILKHPTQKPMALTKRLIQSRINGNAGRTLIPFAGSGSECCVAKSLNVEYMGIEINPQYVDFAQKWLKHVSFNPKDDPAPLALF